MQTAFLLIVIAVVLGVGWIRYAPTDPDDWHVDPAEAGDPGAQGYRVIGREAPRFPGDPNNVLAAFVAVARAEPRVWLLVGSTEVGMVTWGARSTWGGWRA
mgnify:CR=1 FL=1